MHKKTTLGYFLMFMYSGGTGEGLTLKPRVGKISKSYTPSHSDLEKSVKNLLYNILASSLVATSYVSCIYILNFGYMCFSIMIMKDS